MGLKSVCVLLSKKGITAAGNTEETLLSKNDD
jgi:hypothetical protein